jgi:hypothetical protein
VWALRVGEGADGPGRAWDATPVGPELPESFNVAPTHTGYAVVEHVDQQAGGRVDRQIRDLHWELIP